jgi:hypothetical protein
MQISTTDLCRFGTEENDWESKQQLDVVKVSLQYRAARKRRSFYYALHRWLETWPLRRHPYKHKQRRWE